MCFLTQRITIFTAILPLSQFTSDFVCLPHFCGMGIADLILQPPSYWSSPGLLSKLNLMVSSSSCCIKLQFTLPISFSSSLFLQWPKVSDRAPISSLFNSICLRRKHTRNTPNAICSVGQWNNGGQRMLVKLAWKIIKRTSKTNLNKWQLVQITIKATTWHLDIVYN